jgi:uncharacterized cupredoxin-like copper-binding protein
MKIMKDVVKNNIKNVLSIVTLIVFGTMSFQSGKAYQKYVKVDKKTENSYAHAFSPEEISIAVNESGELIMIERATGKYIVYSDAVGQTIFGMYANRIHQEVSNASK